ncbi:MAG TPA: hypothetical protein VK988_04815 [Acidimicrobiales bacterium]|nr:hypothetical protein [Acidimicrobiales bacterium]
MEDEDLNDGEDACHRTEEDHDPLGAAKILQRGGQHSGILLP